MEISAEKIKMMVSSRNRTTIGKDVMVDGEKIKQVRPFKYLGCTLSEYGKSSNELRIRTAIAHSALNKLEPVWRSKDISFAAKALSFSSNCLLSAVHGLSLKNMRDE